MNTPFDLVRIIRKAGFEVDYPPLSHITYCRFIVRCDRGTLCVMFDYALVGLTNSAGLVPILGYLDPRRNEKTLSELDRVLDISNKFDMSLDLESKTDED